MIEERISQLVEYAVGKAWIEEGDRLWAANRILEVLKRDGFGGLVEVDEVPPIAEILNDLCADAYERGVIEGNSASFTDLLDTALIGALLPRPSEIRDIFYGMYLDEGPEAATGWYYELSCDTNYIRRDRIAKDMKWTTETPYGTMDITINLSKPEKDPKAIAAAGKAKASGYPKCLLCAENEGYAGHLSHPARQNHRIIPISLDGTDFYLQYSPYVYYNEHCIVLNKAHTPMHIDEKCFRNLLDFVTRFPHYFIGSNADLPIVGGSVLSHAHYQGGNYEFAMARAEVERSFTLKDFPGIQAGVVAWPMSVIRLRGGDRDALASAAAMILKKWRTYDDPAASVFHETDGEAHSTITPIARRRGEDYELDLVLRNNLTSEEYPLGLFHPHAEKHHIKKENIGLIEVMGLAVLPARLKEELKAVEEALLSGADLTADPKTASHAAWAEEVKKAHPEMNDENAAEILQQEVGKVFAAVLEDAGVFKRSPEGQAAFDRFIETLSIS